MVDSFVDDIITPVFQYFFQYLLTEARVIRKMCRANNCCRYTWVKGSVDIISGYALFFSFLFFPPLFGV